MYKKRYMALALALAEKGRGYVNPNPMVGAVIVKNGRIVGQGYHGYLGGPHAEIEALRKAGPRARGATMYVSLEPCRHFGRTPPCTRAIIKAGIKKVVAAVGDPNPLNNGRGFKELREKGIKIDQGLMAKEARFLNEKFFTYHKKKRPFIAVKGAMTLDGKIATVSGASHWITGAGARKYVHLLRHEYDAIMVGINTVRVDDPALTARFSEKRRRPCLVIADSRLSVSLKARVVNSAGENKCFIAATSQASLSKRKMLSNKGLEILITKSKEGRVDLGQAVNGLAQKGITSILVEGGGEIIYSLLREKLVDKIYFFYSPKIVGGRTALTAVEGKGIAILDKAIRVKNITSSRLGEDLLITGYPSYV